MTDIFVIPFAKVQRASKFISDLEALIADYLENEPFIVQGLPHYLPNGAFEVDIGMKGFGHEPGLIVDDAIHNLRASLDLMATELAEINKQKTNNVYFPFAASKSELDEQIKKKNFQRAGNDAVKLLKRLAPYKGGNAALRAIHDFDVQNKHQKPIATPLSHSLSVNVAHFPTGYKHVVPINSEGLKFYCPSDSALKGQELVPTLQDFVQVVDGILKSFASLVAARTP
jgi:hypothetical protein